MSPLVDLIPPCAGTRWGCRRLVERGGNGCFAEPISGPGHLQTKVEQIRERTRFPSRLILAWRSWILLSSFATRDFGDKESGTCSDASI